MAAVDKDTLVTLTVTIALNDGTNRSEVAAKLPMFRAEHAGIAFRTVRHKLAEAARDIAVYDVELLEQIGEVQQTTPN
jgi:hypothetical protein